MNSFTEEIKARFLTSSIVSRKVNLKSRGNQEYLGLCPFHKEKTPSFTVSDIKGFYHCFGCGESGDIFKFVMLTQQLNYNDAVEYLAKEAGIELPRRSYYTLEIEKQKNVFERIFELATLYFQEQLLKPLGKEAYDYLKKRKLDIETISKFRLGYALHDNQELLTKLKSEFNENDIIITGIFQKDKSGNIFSFFRERIMFPIFNRKGKVIAFGGRVLKNIQPKYINSKENPLFKKGNELYSLNFALPFFNESKKIIVVEGYMDVITLYQRGFKNVVAPLGTALKISQIQTIWHMHAIPVLCFDTDAAGQKATLKTCYESLPFISSDQTLNVIKLFDSKDPDEFILKNGNESFKKIFDNSISLSEYLFDHELNASEYKTPEEKTGFKKKLLTLTNYIKDKDLSSNYRKYFLDKYYNIFFKKEKFNKRDLLNSELAINSAMHYNNYHIESILSILIFYPNLLSNNNVVSQLERLDISSKKLDTLRNYLLSFAYNLFVKNEDFKKVDIFNKLNVDFDEFTDNENLSYINNEDEALHFLSRLFSLNTLNNLQNEMNHILKDLNNNPTDINFKIFINLKKEEEQLKIELGIV